MLVILTAPELRLIHSVLARRAAEARSDIHQATVMAAHPLAPIPYAAAARFSDEDMLARLVALEDKIDRNIKAPTLPDPDPRPGAAQARDQHSNAGRGRYLDSQGFIYGR